MNRRKPDEDNPDLAYAFQAEIEVQGERAFIPRPDLRDAQAEDWDEQVADLHYADTPELATGHGVSADWDIVDGACRRLRTAWIPSASVEKTETRDVPAVELSMETLGALDDGAAAEVALRPLVDEYRAWIEGRREEMEALQGGRRDTAEGLLLRAAHAADRIEYGIALLASNEDALDAFRVANRAVASALRRGLRRNERGERDQYRPVGRCLRVEGATHGRCRRESTDRSPRSDRDSGQFHDRCRLVPSASSRLAQESFVRSAGHMARGEARRTFGRCVGTRDHFGEPQRQGASQEGRGTSPHAPGPTSHSHAGQPVHVH